MNIVLATDNNYVQHCAITISSILRNNSNVTIYVLTEDLLVSNKKILRDEVRACNARIEFVMVNKEIIDSLPMPSHSYLAHISRATYYRLLLPSILPLDVDKVIYLDCDLIVNHSLDDLWNTDIDNYAIAACKQIGGGRDGDRLGIPIEYGYFNAGVLLINVEYWREHEISKALIDFLFTHSDIVVFHDQDALNVVLHDQCYHLHQRWNMNYATYSKQFLSVPKDDLGYDYAKEIGEAIDFQECPSILHYSARIKPWSWKCTHPLVHLYYDYAKYSVHYKNLRQPCSLVRFVAMCREKLINLLVKIKHV